MNIDPNAGYPEGIAMKYRSCVAEMIQQFGDVVQDMAQLERKYASSNQREFAGYLNIIYRSLLPTVIFLYENEVEIDVKEGTVLDIDLEQELHDTSEHFKLSFGVGSPRANDTLRELLSNLSAGEIAQLLISKYVEFAYRSLVDLARPIELEGEANRGMPETYLSGQSTKLKNSIVAIGECGPSGENRLASVARNLQLKHSTSWGTSGEFWSWDVVHLALFTRTITNAILDGVPLRDIEKTLSESAGLPLRPILVAATELVPDVFEIMDLTISAFEGHWAGSRSLTDLVEEWGQDHVVSNRPYPKLASSAEEDQFWIAIKGADPKETNKPNVLGPLDSFSHVSVNLDASSEMLVVVHNPGLVEEDAELTPLDSLTALYLEPKGIQQVLILN